MPRIKIKDLPKEADISKEEMRSVCGGGISIFSMGATTYQNLLVSLYSTKGSLPTPIPRPYWG